MMMCFTLYNKAPFCQLQWRFYIRGRWGTSPPVPDDAVVQKAQYIRTLRQNIYFFMQSSVNVFVYVCVRISLTHLIHVCFCLCPCSVKCCKGAVLLCSVGYGASLRPLPWKR